MRSHQVAVLLSTFATVALVAPAVQAGTLVTSLPIVFVDKTGGFVPTSPTQDPINGIGATIINAGQGDTEPFTPATGGAILGNFVAANALGSFTYQSSDVNAKLEFALVAGGTSVFNQVLAGGIDTIAKTPFNFALSAVVPPNFDRSLFIHFRQTGNALSTLAGVKLQITTKTPEPGNMTTIGLLGLGLAGAATRRQLQEKAKTKV
ncbi:MAG: PEP-CTERM sorting domain-containing protein [Microcystis wesenbergii Mw_QC_S_20081001_S30D]|uniref:PEP-CTERM sorting domain-containing protein n=1 Tax=Microcystis wesenbergii Mw_QC_S_20081001_S30D TaxID=2486245 RepID=A0A552JL92_9CHRO|nr:MAG: PEP-CTERM sorting domain-containing protein [Microcystis wesenbergii Mw_QC_S_20081001_S30D]TRV02657.1 MAG: PEP-CTERM sorting domain-containing protein [Microcystis wesenbergii Mw_QC_S_20081001_S30]